MTLQEESGDGTAASKEAAGLEASGGVAGLLDRVALRGGRRARGGARWGPGAVARDRVGRARWVCRGRAATNRAVGSFRRGSGLSRGSNGDRSAGLLWRVRSLSRRRGGGRRGVSRRGDRRRGLDRRGRAGGRGRHLWGVCWGSLSRGGGRRGSSVGGGRVGRAVGHLSGARRDGDDGGVVDGGGAAPATLARTTVRRRSPGRGCGNSANKGGGDQSVTHFC